MPHKPLIIDGRAVALRLRGDIAARVKSMPHAPGLAVILVGDDPASGVYVRGKIKACVETGIRSQEFHLPASTPEGEIQTLILRLNNDPQVHGILLQLPLPPGVDSAHLIQSIAPEKDVDGLTHVNQGKLVAGDETGLVPCTPLGTLKLLREFAPNLAGKHAVVIGRSLLFGKPMGQLLLAADCTVTQAHSKTRDLPGICRQADILIAAVGRPAMVQGDWIKPGAVVMDVGINRLADGSLCGDVDFEAARQHASVITPVPGGIGPMTIACLLENTLKAAAIR